MKQHPREYDTPKVTQILLRADSSWCVSGSIDKLEQEDNLIQWADDDDPAV